MALIDKDSVVDAIDGTTWYHISKTGELVAGANGETDIPLYKADGIYKAVESVPEMEAVDAVPIVRCKDCKYFEPENVDTTGVGWCEVYDNTKSPNGFCDEGKQMDGED